MCGRTARPRNLAEGILPMRCRASRMRPAFLTPNQVYEVTIDLWATSHVFFTGALRAPGDFFQQFPTLRPQPEHRRGPGHGQPPADSGADHSPRPTLPVSHIAGGDTAVADLLGARRPASTTVQDRCSSSFASQDGESAEVLIPSLLCELPERRIRPRRPRPRRTAAAIPTDLPSGSLVVPAQLNNRRRKNGSEICAAYFLLRRRCRMADGGPAGGDQAMRARPERGGWRSSCGGSVGKKWAATLPAIRPTGW